MKWLKIYKKELIKVPLNQSINDISLKTIGIDSGQSLTKIAYVEGEELCLLVLPTNSSFNEIDEFLELKKNLSNKFNFTGGKAFNLYKKFSKELKTNLCNEFQAIITGLDNLFKINKKTKLPESLIVTIGTGTSVIWKKNESFEHIGGTALGGGFFMGLIKLLFDINNYQEAIKIANKGNRYNVDLKVSDIYDIEDDRIDAIFREFTASSFGKINENYETNTIKKEDIINSIINVIGENIGVIASKMAENKKLTQILFSGGFLKDNRILKRILTIICTVNNKKAVFLKNSEFIGAIGALLG